LKKRVPLASRQNPSQKEGKLGRRFEDRAVEAARNHPIDENLSRGTLA
jgi:hypothetical protein